MESKYRVSVLQVVSTPQQCTKGLAGITGPERRAANLASRWADEGIEVTVLYPRHGRLWDKFSESGVRLLEFDLNGKWDLSAIKRLTYEIKSTGVQIIHTQGGAALDLMAVRAARYCNIASVITRPVMISDLVNRSCISRRLFEFIDKNITLRSCSALITVSQDGYDKMCQNMAHERVHLILNGIKPVLPNVPQRENHDGIVRIGMIGHLEHYKGFDLFLKVAARLHKRTGGVRFDIVGDGSERAALESQACALGVANVTTFHGLLDDVSQVLRELDIFLFTSRREGLSVAVLEAMSAGLPIVASNVGGIADQIYPGKNGMILEPDDVEGMVQVCNQLIDNARLRKIWGIRSRKIFDKKFSEDRMLAEHVSLYYQMI